MSKLIYKGGGSFVGVPARDLTDEDFTERSESFEELGITEEILIKSGLYEKVEAEQAEPKKKQKRGAFQDAAKDGE